MIITNSHIFRKIQSNFFGLLHQLPSWWRLNLTQVDVELIHLLDDSLSLSGGSASLATFIHVVYIPINVKSEISPSHYSAALIRIVHILINSKIGDQFISLSPGSSLFRASDLLSRDKSISHILYLVI